MTRRVMGTGAPTWISRGTSSATFGESEGIVASAPRAARLQITSMRRHDEIAQFLLHVLERAERHQPALGRPTPQNPRECDRRIAGPDEDGRAAVSRPDDHRMPRA